MGRGWRDRTLLDLLTEFGLELLPEHDFPNDGWSGATFTSLLDGYGRRFILKRTSLAKDWIARATLDDDLREGWLASMPTPALLAWLPRAVIPYLGAAADGDGVAILMPDLSTELISWERPGHDPVDRHRHADARHPGDRATPRAAVEPVGRGGGGTRGRSAPPWCPLPERLTLLTPLSATRYAADGNPVGERFLAGWDAFDRSRRRPRATSSSGSAAT